MLPVETWHGMFGWSMRYAIKSQGFVRVNKPGAAEHIYSYTTVPMRGVSTLFALGKKAGDPELLGRVGCPVLMIVSENDEAANASAARRAFAALGAPVAEIWEAPERNNHHVFWDYDEGLVKRRIEEFLDAATATPM